MLVKDFNNPFVFSNYSTRSLTGNYQMSSLPLLCMYKYFIKTPWIIKRLFKSYVWSMPATDKEVYLTFDDGPHQTITPWILDELKKYNAAATFFCIGKNVAQHADVYKRIIDEGHAIGNHTHNHLNGWKTETDKYIADIKEAAKHIATNLFRPPYGRIKKSQAKRINEALKNSTSGKVIMWDVLSADFDNSITPEECLKNVLQNVEAGSIVVFHDSEKAFKNLQFVLPKVLAELDKKGYVFRKIEG